MKIKTLRSGKLYSGEEHLGFSHKEVGTNSVQSGFTMELFLARVYIETVMIIGRWTRNDFLPYIRIQVINPSEVISDLMVTTQAL